MLYSQENKGVAVLECEKKALSDASREKYNDIEVPAETSETFDGGHFAEVNGSYDLADIITGRRTVSSLSCIEKYGYLTKHYCLSDQESLFKEKVVKSGETKILSYQLSRIKIKWWHAYSKELQGGFCKACILFDDFATNAPRRDFVKNAFQNVSKAEKISEHETKGCHDKALEKAKSFVMIFEDPTKAVTHDKHDNDKYQKNFHTFKLIIEAVLLCAEQGIAC